MTAPHILRPAARARRSFVPVPAAPAYPPGHFTALLRRHDWPPRFEPQMPVRNMPDWSALSTANREKRVAMGDPGTIVGLSQRGDEVRRQILAHRAGR